MLVDDHSRAFCPKELRWRLSPEVREKRMTEARHHLHVSCKMYRKQHDAGRTFLHEAPWGASSWRDPEVQAILALPGVKLVRGPMCRWHMMATETRSSRDRLRSKGDRLADKRRRPGRALTRRVY